MSYCPRDGNCEYNDRVHCGTDYCVWPGNGCPYDLLDVHVDNSVAYRQALFTNIADLRDKQYLTGAEKGRLKQLESALQVSLQK